MSVSKTKPTFGREMIPCEYTAKWANQLSKDEVLVIRAEDNKIRESLRNEGR